MLGRTGQRLNGGAHGLVGRAQDINSINLQVIDDTDGPRDPGVGNELFINGFAELGRELL